jgi:hypothetical protein
MADIIPVEATTFDFTPTAFDGRDDKPVFTLHYGTRRHRTRFQQLQIKERLTRHDEADIHDAVIGEIKTMFDGTPEAMKEAVDKTRAYWDASDKLKSDTRAWAEYVQALPKDTPEDQFPPRPTFEFDDVDRNKVETLLDMVDRNSDRLAGIQLDNTNHEIGTRRNSVRVVLESFTGFDLALVRDKDGVITADSCDALEDAFERFMRAKGFSLTEASKAWAELAYAAINGMTVSAEQGNASVSPPSIPSTVEVSTEPASEPSPLMESEPSNIPENG